MSDLRTRPAQAEDLPAVRALIVEAGLPAADLALQFPDAYVVLEEGERIVGTAGLEVHGEYALLRSVAVAPSRRGAGLGRALTQDRLRAARTRGLRAVYLLTTTAPDFFARLGFERTARDGAPAALQLSSEFAAVCPASAVCMVAGSR